MGGGMSKASGKKKKRKPQETQQIKMMEHAQQIRKPESTSAKPTSGPPTNGQPTSGQPTGANPTSAKPTNGGTQAKDTRGPDLTNAGSGSGSGGARALSQISPAGVTPSGHANYGTPTFASYQYNINIMEFNSYDGGNMYHHDSWSWGTSGTNNGSHGGYSRISSPPPRSTGEYRQISSPPPPAREFIEYPPAETGQINTMFSDENPNACTIF